MTVRLQRDGRRWIQSIATAGRAQGGVAELCRIENPAPGGRPCLEAIPDAAVRDAILERVNGSPLQEVCEITAKHTVRELSLGESTRAELSISAETIRSKGRSAALYEAAVELVGGSPAGLFDIAHALFPDGGLRFSRLSDAARGYLLAEAGEVEPSPAPRFACAVALDPAQTAEQAARDIVRECFDQIAANMLAVQQLDDPEGPHQLRVGLRRLRSALSVFSPVLQSAELLRLSDEARWLGEEVGRLRDLDVVAHDIVRREAEAYPDEPCLLGLADALSREAAEVREQLRRSLTKARAQAFLIDLVQVRGDARLVCAAGLRPDRTTGGAGCSVGRDRTEQTLEEARQARPRTANARCGPSARTAQTGEETALRGRVLCAALSDETGGAIREALEGAADGFRRLE